MSNIETKLESARALLRESEAYGFTQPVLAKSFFDESVEIYRTALEENPENHEVWFELGEVLENSGQAKEGYDCFKRAAQLNFSNDLYVFKLEEIDLIKLIIEQAEGIADKYGMHSSEKKLENWKSSEILRWKAVPTGGRYGMASYRSVPVFTEIFHYRKTTIRTYQLRSNDFTIPYTIRCEDIDIRPVCGHKKNDYRYHESKRERTLFIESDEAVLKVIRDPTIDLATATLEIESINNIQKVRNRLLEIIEYYRIGWTARHDAPGL